MKNASRRECQEDCRWRTEEEKHVHKGGSEVHHTYIVPPYLSHSSLTPILCNLLCLHIHSTTTLFYL